MRWHVLKGKIEDFSVLFKELSFLPQQTTKTETLILLESRTNANSCSGNKVCECTVCKGMKRQSREKDK